MEKAYVSSGGSGRLFGRLLLSFLLTLLISLLLLAAASLLLMRAPDPHAWIKRVGVVLPTVCALLGGILAGRSTRRAGALMGILSGLLFTGTLIFLSWILGESTLALGARILLYAVLLLLSMLGGILGAMRGHKRKKGRRKRR